MAVYIVFDVETPNRANDRMSAIGITAIKDNRIAASYFSLVDTQLVHCIGVAVNDDNVLFVFKLRQSISDR